MDLFTPYEYVLIDIANQYGLDKEDWDVRLKWTRTNEPNLESLMGDADDPMLYIKAVYALRDIQNNIPTGFVMGLDATSSGVQIMSTVMGCEIGMRNTNVIDSGKREDFYRGSTRLLNKKLGTSTIYDRKEVKKAIMTHFYQSTSKPKEIFGEGHELAMFYQSLIQRAPGASLLLQFTSKWWQPYAREHAWTLPDGFEARVKVYDTVDKEIEVDELKTASGGHATFTHRKKIYQGLEYALSLSANVIHSIDGYIVRQMRRMATAQGFDILCIHDSFWCSPNHAEKMRQNYNDIFVSLYEGDLINDIAKQITGKDWNIPKLSTGLSHLIKKANYSIC